MTDEECEFTQYGKCNYKETGCGSCEAKIKGLQAIETWTDDTQGMTDEEAIAYGKRVIGLGLNDETQAFCELAIKALQKEAKLKEAIKDIKANMESYCDTNCPYSEKQREVMCKACMMGDAIDIVDNHTEKLI